MSTNYHKFSGTVDADTLTGTAVSSTDTSGSTVVKRSGGNFSAGTITASSLAGGAVSSTDTTGSTVVKRSNGNFSAGTITASLSGHATSATNATNATNIYTSGSGATAVRYLAGFPATGSSPLAMNYSDYWYFRGTELAGTGGTLDASYATIRANNGLIIKNYIYKIDSQVNGYFGYENSYRFRVNDVLAVDVDDERVGVNDLSPSFALDVNGSLRCFSFTNSSDERIKKNITDINDGDALNTIRLLQPKRYEYIDTKKANTEGQVWGFIAQELEDVMPYAVDTIADFIPNVFEWGNKTADNHVINVNTSNILPDQTILQIIDGKNKTQTLTIESIIDSQNIRVSEDLSSIEGGQVDDNGDLVYSLNDEGRKEYASGNKIFVYGQKVNDFKTIKKNFIWTVATAALQEVDRQLQVEKTKVSTLQSQLTSVLARLDALESA